MSIELVQMEDQTAFWAVSISVVVFLALLYIPIQDDSLRGVRRLFTFCTGLFGFGVASVWLFGNYVFVPGF